MTYTRRELLRAGVAGVVVATAGCAGVLDDSDDGTDDGADGDTPDVTGGDAATPAPTATFEFEEGDDELVITHDDGESLQTDNVEFRGPFGDWIPTSDTLATGDRITLVLSASAGSGDTVRIVWIDPSDGDETVIDEYVLEG